MVHGCADRGWGPDALCASAGYWFEAPRHGVHACHAPLATPWLVTAIPPPSRLKR